MASAVSHRHNTNVHVLNFFHDDDDSCALTVLVNSVRFHIIVDSSKIQTPSGPGAKLARDYHQILLQIKRQENNEIAVKYGHDDDDSDSAHGSDEDSSENSQSDSAVDISDKLPEASSQLAKEEPVVALKKWILAPFSTIFEEKAPASQMQSGKTLEEWYSGITAFYSLVVKDDQLVAVEEKASDDLERRIQKITPHLPMPQYICNLDTPWIAARDIIVLGASDDPSPYHPNRVKVKDETYFLKTVDSTQPQTIKREIKILKQIEDLGLHKEFRVPLVKGLVGFEDSETEMMGFLMTEIDSPTPLTKLLDEDVSQRKRDKWAKEANRIKELLHKHNIVWGDAKADNFMVDKNDELWIIDFGGSYTEGWVDPELNETREGDDMGVDKIVNALHDPVANTMDDEESSKELKQKSNPKKRKPDDDDEKKQSDRDNTSEPHQSKRARHSEKQYDTKPPSQQTAEKKCANEAELEASTKDQEDGENYCYCEQPSSGDMVACDNDDCQRQWFHFACLDIEKAPQGEWFCKDCRS